MDEIIFQWEYVEEMLPSLGNARKLALTCDFFT